MKFSIIVPVYNAEKYLNRCINSVIKQSYKNWEMIIVNDGSQDSSAIIIDEAVMQDDRIVAIHQKNTGAGKARNRGISIATGEYIVFLDADDYIDEDYLSLLEPKAKENDIVFVDVEQVTKDGKIIRSEPMSAYKYYNKEKLLRAQMTGKIFWGGVRKAVKLDLLKDNDIQYTFHSIGEEALYSFRTLYAARTISFLDEKPVYFYVAHDDSLSSSKNLDPWGDVAESMAEYLKVTGLYKQYANTVNAFRCTAAVVSLDKITQFSSKEELYKKLKERLIKYRRTFDKGAGIDTTSMSIKAKVFVPFLKIGVVFPIVWCSRLKSMMRQRYKNTSIIRMFKKKIKA